MTTGGNGPSCSGWVTNVSIGPDDVGISTMRSCMVPRHYAAADGAVKTPRRRGSMAALFSPELFRRALRPAGPPPRDGLQRARPGDAPMRFGLLYEAQRPFNGTNVDWNKLYKETL